MSAELKCEFRLEGARRDCRYPAITTLRLRGTRRRACGTHRMVALKRGWIDETDEEVARRQEVERAARMGGHG